MEDEWQEDKKLYVFEIESDSVCKLTLSISELTGDTLMALQEFYTERDEREKRFEDLKAAMEEQGHQSQLSMDMFSEDWNASQFWVCVLMNYCKGKCSLMYPVQQRDGHAAGKAIACWCH